MASERIIRDGELTERSLIDALHAELREGRRAAQVAVGSKRLELAAMRILRPHSGLDELRASLPNVVLDRELPAGGWELREAAAA